MFKSQHDNIQGSLFNYDMHAVLSSARGIEKNEEEDIFFRRRAAKCQGYFHQKQNSVPSPVKRSDINYLPGGS